MHTATLKEKNVEHDHCVISEEVIFRKCVGGCDTPVWQCVCVWEVCVSCYINYKRLLKEMCAILLCFLCSIAFALFIAFISLKKQKNL